MSDLVVVSVKLPRSIVEQLNILSNRSGKTRSEIIREALRRYMVELYGSY
ncbi:MAG: CopG family transcriptional regulator [Ignisphaera sp.]